MRERGTSLIVVATLTLVALAVVTLLLMGSTTLVRQARANHERAKVRMGTRGGLGVIGAYLNKKLNESPPAPHKPPATASNNDEWWVDADGNDYIVFYGRGGTGTFTWNLDRGAATPPLSSETNPTALGSSFDWARAGTSTRKQWLADARAYTSGPARDATISYVVRVDMTGDPSTQDGWYYHAWSVGLSDDASVRAGKPVVLVHQAAIVPTAPKPFSGAVLTGLQGLNVNGTGNLTGSGGDPALASSGAIELVPP
jgi:hypothetical protein